MLKRISIILIVFLFLVSCNSKKNNKNCNVSYDINDLVSAIDENNINIIQEALDSGFNINTTIGADNSTLLDYAIDKNREHIAILLIEKGIDINHIDNNGLATFSKAIGNMSQILLNSFLLHGVNYTDIALKDMNYFVYMLYKEDYESALSFISNDVVFNFFKDENDLFVYLIYYWNPDWSIKIGNILLNKHYNFDKHISYYFYAIDEYSLSAVTWLDSIGISTNEKYYEDRYGLDFTPLEYAENKYLEMRNYLGKDYAYSQDDEEIIAMQEIIEYLENSPKKQVDLTQGG